MLTVEQVSKRYGAQQVLDPVSHAFRAGATTVLLGPSGCGKSTLLRICVGLLIPDSGQVIFDDIPLTPANILTLRHRIGYVIQEGGLFPHLSARDNVTLLARYLKKSFGTRLQELTDLVQLPNASLDRYPKDLSGGQRQRVSLMRALLLDPDLLLLDEPLGALDPLIRYELQNQLKLIFQELGKTVVLVTHDLAEAAYLAEEVLLMGNGKILQQGTMNDLREHPADPFVASFLKTQRV
jgi:osmoprotectant transport system ATP-binding protein